MVDKLLSRNDWIDDHLDKYQIKTNHNTLELKEHFNIEENMASTFDQKDFIEKINYKNKVSNSKKKRVKCETTLSDEWDMDSNVF
jgi:hypothetical protein